MDVFVQLLVFPDDYTYLLRNMTAERAYAVKNALKGSLSIGRYQGEGNLKVPDVRICSRRSSVPDEVPTELYQFQSFSGRHSSL